MKVYESKDYSMWFIPSTRFCSLVPKLCVCFSRNHFVIHRIKCAFSKNSKICLLIYYPSPFFYNLSMLHFSLEFLFNSFFNSLVVLNSFTSDSTQLFFEMPWSSHPLLSLSTLSLSHEKYESSSSFWCLPMGWTHYLWFGFNTLSWGRYSLIPF